MQRAAFCACARFVPARARVCFCACFCACVCVRVRAFFRAFFCACFCACVFLCARARAPFGLQAGMLADDSDWFCLLSLLSKWSSCDCNSRTCATFDIKTSCIASTCACPQMCAHCDHKQCLHCMHCVIAVLRVCVCTLFVKSVKPLSNFGITTSCMASTCVCRPACILCLHFLHRPQLRVCVHACFGPRVRACFCVCMQVFVRACVRACAWVLTHARTHTRTQSNT